MVLKAYLEYIPMSFCAHTLGIALSGHPRGWRAKSSFPILCSDMRRRRELSLSHLSKQSRTLLSSGMLFAFQFLLLSTLSGEAKRHDAKAVVSQAASFFSLNSKDGQVWKLSNVRDKQGGLENIGSLSIFRCRERSG
jgi:hypothetical protein